MRRGRLTADADTKSAAPCANRGTARALSFPPTKKDTNSMRSMNPGGRGRHRKPSKTWLCLLGDVLADWNLTARTAVLLVVVFAGLSSVMVSAFGATGIAILIGLFLVLRRTATGGCERASAG